MNIAQKKKLWAAVLNPFNPYTLPNLAARYSLDGPRGPTTYLLNGSNVALIADRSSNSAVNGLVLNGASGQWASSPDSAATSVFGTGIDVRVDLSLVNWTIATVQQVIGKFGSNGEYRLVNDTGTLIFAWKDSGGTSRSASATTTLSFSAYQRSWVRATLLFNNGSGGNNVTFYTSDDGSMWTQLGGTVTQGFTTDIIDSTSVVSIGSNNGANSISTGIIYRAQIYNGINGTLAFDANFTTVAKLATSFTESSSNAATVTITSSGDLGARICGARDLVQLTAAKQPAFSTSSGYNTATFDGSNDYMKSATFPLSQPFSRYSVFSGTWVINRYIADGATADSTELQAYSSSPKLLIHAGATASSIANGGLATATRGVVAEVFSGAASSLRVNTKAATSGSIGTNAANGLTIGAKADGSVPYRLVWSETFLHSVADPNPLQLSIARYLMREWGIT